MQKPWYETTFRWGQTNLTEDDPALCDLDFWKEQWKKTRVQGLIINGGGIVAYYQSKFPLQYRATSLGETDYFGIWNKAAREAGLIVIARMDINRTTKDFYDAHPDWFCRDKNGDPIISQDRYFTCVNSDYYKVYVPDILREIISLYQPDGFGDNSWKGLSRDKICYCDNCKTKFKAEAGLELPEKPDWNDPVYAQWIKWSYDCRTENWDLFNQVSMESGGENCLWLGMIHADPINLSGGFGDLRALSVRSKIILSDHQSRDPLNGFEQNSLNGNLLRLASGNENMIVTESMANYVRGFRSFRLASNPAEETQTWIEEGFAGGVSPWYHHIGGSQNDRRQFNTPVPLFQWHAENEKYLYNRTNIANIGIVWSQENADFHGRENAEEIALYPWTGFCRALTKHRIPFLAIHADDIEKYAGRIDVLILPDLAVLSPEQEKAVLSFTEKGGSLIFSGMTGEKDQFGISKTKNTLFDAFDLTLTGKTQGVFQTGTSNWEWSEAHSYLLLPEKRHEILNDFENTDILAFGGGLMDVQSRGALQPIAGLIPSFPIYPPEFSWIRERKPETGTIFAGETKSNARIVYFAADIDRCYGRTLLPDHAKLLTNAVQWASRSILPLSVSGTGNLDCAAYQQDNQYIIHIVNLTGDAGGYRDCVCPVHKISISVDTKGKSFKKALLTVTGKSTPVQMQNGRAEFLLESINEHEMIVLQAD